MSERSAFEKIHVDTRDKADLAGVLEQLNLPPAVVDFARKHQRAIFIAVAVVSIMVVAWAVYDSYADKRQEMSSSALAMAKELDGEQRVVALKEVAEEYSGTDAALWAEIELAQYAMGANDHAAAQQYYSQVLREIAENNPLYPLTIFGLAQAHESLGQHDDAIQQYALLKNMDGYQNIGYNGTARIFEVQGDKKAAINEYEQYLGTLDDVAAAGEKEFIMEKINRLKASL